MAGPRNCLRVNGNTRACGCTPADTAPPAAPTVYSRRCKGPPKSTEVEAQHE